MTSLTHLGLLQLYLLMLSLSVLTLVLVGLARR